MEPEYICQVECDSTGTNLFRVGATYDVMLIDGKYFVFDDRYSHSEVFKSEFRDAVWLCSGSNSVFQEKTK